MLTIEHCDVEETIRIGDLFNELGFNNQSSSTDESGDSYITNQWPIEVLSLDTYYPIDGFRWTKPEKQVRLYHKTISVELEDTIPFLQCSPDHIVLKRTIAGIEWTKVKDLVVGDFIVSRLGIRKVCSIEEIDEVERLCDLQVAIAHSYFADNVLSHNSHFLVQLGANALRQQKNVLHYTLELSETAVGRRYDSNLCEVNSDDVFDNKEMILDKYKTAQLGKLVIKEFPTTTASVYTIRAHMERLELKGFRPDMVIIDYADIMRSTRQLELLRQELKLIYEELRGLASEKKICVITASQSNKEGSNADVLDMTNMSESYGKAHICDMIVSISRKTFEKASGAGRLYIAKNRAGKDGLVYPIKIDTARSKFDIIGEAGSPDAAKQEDDKDFKRVLKTKWDQLKNDPAIVSNAKPESI
jgi:hypothetical protein